jgi:hypothetical protein
MKDQATLVNQLKERLPAIKDSAMVNPQKVEQEDTARGDENG